MYANLYLVFETDYIFEGEIFTFITDSFVPADENDNPTDKQFIDEVKRVQAPIMANNDCQLVEVRMRRLTEFEYMRYKKKGVLA